MKKITNEQREEFARRAVVIAQEIRERPHGPTKPIMSAADALMALAQKWVDAEVAEPKGDAAFIACADFSKAVATALASPQPATVEPIDMVLRCPKCGLQHVDGHDARAEIEPGYWTNPTHRSHLCHGCAWVWRPADVPTNGVAAIKTKGKADSAPLASPTPKK